MVVKKVYLRVALWAAQMVGKLVERMVDRKAGLWVVQKADQMVVMMAVS